MAQVPVRRGPTPFQDDNVEEAAAGEGGEGEKEGATLVVGVVDVVGGGATLVGVVGGGATVVVWIVVGVVDVVEGGLEVEVGGVDAAAHDASVGSETPYCAQTWSARLTSAVEYSQTLVLCGTKFPAVLTLLVLSRAGLGNAAG